MRTYVPYPNFTASVTTFDLVTLRSQSEDVIQILRILHEVADVEKPERWAKHPEIIKWRGHEPHLCAYGFELAQTDGGVFDLEDRVAWHMDCATSGEYTLEPPDWWGHTDYHVAEQAALLRLDLEHYVNHFEGVRLDTPPAWMLKSRG